MVKLYLKKLLTILLYVVAVVAVFYIGYGILATFSNFFRDVPVVRYLILLGIPLAIIFWIIWNYRVENAVLRRELLSCDKEQASSFGGRCRLIFGFSHFRAEALAFATYAFLFVLPFSFASKAAWYADLFAGVIIFLLITAICCSVDLLFWILIYKKWTRES